MFRYPFIYLSLCCVHVSQSVYVSMCAQLQICAKALSVYLCNCPRIKMLVSASIMLS